jgi:hypothetical protein
MRGFITAVGDIAHTHPAPTSLAPHSCFVFIWLPRSRFWPLACISLDELICEEGYGFRPQKDQP